MTPDNEPVLFGAFATAVLEVAIVFAPRFGITLTGGEQTALGALVAAAVPIAVALFVRRQVTPNAALTGSNPPASTGG